MFLFGHPDESYGFGAMHKISGTIKPLLDRASPLRSAHMRDPGGPQTHFAVESFMDELALATNMDPVAFRLRYVTNPRDIALIKAVAEKAQWQPHVGPRKQLKGDVYVGQGIAYAARGGTRVATIARSRSTARPARSAPSATPSGMTAARSSRRICCASRSRATSCSRPAGRSGKR